MNSNIVNIAQEMLLDLEGMMCCRIHNGATDINGRRYQLSFNIRRDAYEELVAMTSCRQYVARPPASQVYLVGIPVSVVAKTDAPLVALVAYSENDFVRLFNSSLVGAFLRI